MLVQSQVAYLMLFWGAGQETGRPRGQHGAVAGWTVTHEPQHITTVCVVGNESGAQGE